MNWFLFLCRTASVLMILMFLYNFNNLIKKTDISQLGVVIHNKRGS